MYTAPASAAGGHTQRQARRGLTIYFVAVVLLTAGSDVALIATRDPVWGLVRMFAPAAASVLARLMLREGFADVSFRLGGRRTWIYIGLALVFPVVIGLIVYGTAWATGLAQFDPHPSGELGDQLAARLSSPVLSFATMLAFSTFVLVFPNCLFAAGEEMGWRGYMLTRLIDAGVPRPILASGLIWGLWHVPLVLAGLYGAGSSPALSVVMLMFTSTSFAFVLARMRLETGSIWPPIVLHGAMEQHHPNGVRSGNRAGSDIVDRRVWYPNRACLDRRGDRFLARTLGDAEGARTGGLRAPAGAHSPPGKSMMVKPSGSWSLCSTGFI